jgi:hypothetical protein
MWNEEGGEEKEKKKCYAAKWYVITPRKHKVLTQVFIFSWWPLRLGRYIFFFFFSCIAPIKQGILLSILLLLAVVLFSCAPLNTKADASPTVSQCSFHDDDHQMIRVWEMKRKLMKRIQGRIKTT